MAVHVDLVPLYPHNSIILSDLCVLVKYPPSGCWLSLSFLIQNLAYLFKIGNECTMLTYLSMLSMLEFFQA